MFYQKLSECNIIGDNKKQTIDCYISKMSVNSVFTLSQFVYDNKLDTDTSKKVLQWLCLNDILTQQYAIKCPKCGYMIEYIEDINKLKEVVLCISCNLDVEITADDVIVIYALKTPPFVDGQQIEKKFVKKNNIYFAAHLEDTLANLIKCGNANSLFYNPSEDEYVLLKECYDKIFMATTKQEKGYTLENLVKMLFNLCTQFKASTINISNNQIDCYVRNKFSVPGTELEKISNDYIVECKNEAKTPRITYLNKLHSILEMSGKKRGIIFSKCSAPKTYKVTARDIYLSKGIIIISINKDDLYQIVCNRMNFLECISRKENEIITNSKSNLIEAGLYDT